MKKEKLISVGGFDQSFYPLFDHAFWIQSLNKGVSIYKYSKQVATSRIEDNTSIKKDTILAFIDKRSDVARLALDNKKNRICRMLINASKDGNCISFYMRKLISKNEFKQKTKKPVVSYLILSFFKAYYVLYKFCLFIGQ